MKKIPTLYTKNSKGRYQEYKIPDLDISKTFYRKINGKYEPVSMLSYSPLEEGVWVVTRESSTIEHIRGTYLRECFHLDKAADIERFPLSKMGHIQKVAERIIDELRLGNTDFAIDAEKYLAVQILAPRYSATRVLILETTQTGK